MQPARASSESKPKPKASFLTGWRVVVQTARKATTRINNPHNQTGRWGGVRNMGGGGASAGLVVVTVPLDVAVPLAARVTPAGESVQVEEAGAPVQVRATVPVNPFVEVTVAVNVADEPLVTVAEVGDREIVKSGVPATVPVPERATLCGLPESLLVTLSVANSAAVVTGLKVTLMVQFAPAASVEVEAGQVFAETAKSAAFVPVMEVPLMVKAEFAPFVRVTVCAVLVVLTV